MPDTTYSQPGHTKLHIGNDDTMRITIRQRSRRTHDAIDTKLPRTAPTEGLTKHTHDSYKEQTGAKDDEQTKKYRNGTTTETVRLDTIRTLRRGCHDAYRAHYEPRMTKHTKTTIRQTTA